MKNKHFYCYLWKLIVFISILILLTCCESENRDISTHSLSKTKIIKKADPPLSFSNHFQLPVPISEGEFGKVIGWINNDEMIYFTNMQGGSNVYTYGLKTGINKLIFESSTPIVTAVISPDRQKILIHSAPSTYEGLISIITDEGEILFNEKLPSVEIVFEWNQFDPNLLLITTFKEDWSFTNFLLNLSKMELQKNKLPEPFAKWTAKGKLAYLDWNENDITLFAPLIQNDLNNEIQLLKDKIFYFDSIQNKILTISVNQAEETASYTFHSNSMIEESSFKIPVLSSYSGWIVPNYDVLADQKIFLTFVPNRSTEADTYQDGFELISFNLDTDERKVLLKNSENVPIKCSPNGKYCLFGYQFEQLLDLNQLVVLPLFQQ